MSNLSQYAETESVLSERSEIPGAKHIGKKHGFFNYGTAILRES